MVSTTEESMPHAVVEGSGLTKSFRRDAEIVHALRGVDLRVAPGEIVGISGASGSGKSTLLAVLCGWEQPDAGDLEHVGGEAVSLPWSELALVPQTLGLLEDLTVRENVLLPARLIKAVDAYVDRAEELMSRLRIEQLAERFPAQISQGEQQRTSIARALLLRPRLLLADEPTAHQDHGLADVVLDCLREHAAAGGSCVLVSHHRNALDRADRVLAMADGVLQ
ncbi:MAG TPA: ATP-binding cassette domain-containing protein [Jatrophihabitantaceae bacterium]|jgi:putative ABC transport system ATP-binding protein|nr:ATP-binding cassette domain-containing protein [Jatrophihabitantaceae bacterium]